MRKVTIFLVDRANYARLTPLLQGLSDDPAIELRIILSGSLADKESFKDIHKDLATLNARKSTVVMEVMGSNLESMTKAIGLGVLSFCQHIQTEPSDIYLIIGDRYEALAAMIAVVYTGNIALHIQGGEISGSIDDTTRHVLTKMAHYHFCANRRALDLICQLGESPNRVFATGCLSVDLAKKVYESNDGPPIFLNKVGVGDQIDFQEGYALVLFHSNNLSVTDFGLQFEEIAKGLIAAGKQAVIFWPNIDPGAKGIEKKIRVYREAGVFQNKTRFVKNLEPSEFLRVIKHAVVVLGNSSSFVREGPSLNSNIFVIGDRQVGREPGGPLSYINPCKEEVEQAVVESFDGVLAGRVPLPKKFESTYGDGNTSQKMISIIKSLDSGIKREKQFTFL